MSKISNAYEALKTYKGTNSMILYLKRLNEKGELLLSETGFNTDYILSNVDYEPFEVNRTVKISDILGVSLKERFNLDFTPAKVRITRVIGEMGESIHCYAQYRQSVQPKLMYLKKKYILEPLQKVEYEEVDVDFDKIDKKTEHLNRKLKDHQKSAVKFMLANKKCILADSMGLGKMEPLDSKIPTPKGFVEMGDISVGSEIFGSDGKIYHVTETFRHKNKPIYRVKFDDSSYVDCGLEHLWLVKDNVTGENKVKSTEELKDSLNGGEKRFSISTVSPVDYGKSEDFVVNPYLLGKYVFADKDKTDEIIYNKTRKRLFSDFSEEFSKNGIVSDRFNNKMPFVCVSSSIDYRKKLLNGILNSQIESDFLYENQEIEYIAKSAALAYDICLIAGSLGCICKASVSYKDGNVYFPIKIRQNCFNDNEENREICRYVAEIEFNRYADAQCITVDSPDNCYLTSENFIVTHNTTSATVAAMETGAEKILVITTASLKSTWEREIGLYEDKENIKVISGSKWDGSTSKFTIINYDIIQNYYEIAMEPKYEDDYLDNGDGTFEKVRVPVMVKDKKTGKLVNKMVKSRKKDNIRDALAKSPLFKCNFDCVIIDEAQKLSNNTSIRYKVISDFLAKAKIPYIFLTTGTPLTNTPMNLYNILKLIGSDVTNDYEFYVKRYCDGKTIYRPGEWKRWADIYDRGNNSDMKKGEFVSMHAKKLTIPQGSSNLDELRERIKHIYIRRLSSDIPGMVNKVVDTRSYDLSEEQKTQYNALWEEYMKAQEEKGDNTNEEYRQLVEGTLVRRFLALEMVENTKKLVDDYLEDGEKVIIVCNFSDEIEKFKEYYGKQAVVYDGKMTVKQKDKAEKDFMTNPKIKVFIGQIEAAGVGLTLTESRVMVFNSYSWLETSNRQMQDRIYRITQTRDVVCIYQLFTDSISQDMFDKVMRKGLVMDATIKAENDK